MAKSYTQQGPFSFTLTPKFSSSVTPFSHCFCFCHGRGCLVQLTRISIIFLSYLVKGNSSTPRLENLQEISHLRPSTKRFPILMSRFTVHPYYHFSYSFGYPILSLFISHSHPQKLLLNPVEREREGGSAIFFHFLLQIREKQREKRVGDG